MKGRTVTPMFSTGVKPRTLSLPAACTTYHAIGRQLYKFIKKHIMHSKKSQKQLGALFFSLFYLSILILGKFTLERIRKKMHTDLSANGNTLVRFMQSIHLPYKKTLKEL